MREIGLSNWLVGATDQRTLRSLRRAGVPCFGMKTALPEGEWACGNHARCGRPALMRPNRRIGRGWPELGVASGEPAGRSLSHLVVFDTGEWAWGSQTFKALGQHKIELVYQSLS